MSFRTLFFAAAAVLFMTACANLATPESATTNEPLEGTYWKLTELDGATVSAHDRQREPSLVLDPEGRRAGGSGGCNQFMGSYTLDGERISFGQLAMTRMACAQGMETEAAFASALSQVKSWQVQGKRLQFYDANGRLLAEFVAQPLG